MAHGSDNPWAPIISACKRGNIAEVLRLHKEEGVSLETADHVRTLNSISFLLHTLLTIFARLTQATITLYTGQWVYTSILGSAKM